MLVFAADTEAGLARAQTLTLAFPGSRATLSRLAASASGASGASGPSGACGVAFVAWPDVLDLYEREFPGLTARARDKTRALADLEAVYLPVTYSAWLVVVRSPDDLAVALETARLLRADTVVCPAFDIEEFPRSQDRSNGSVSRHLDRVRCAR